MAKLGEPAPFYVNPFVEQAVFAEGFGLASLGQIGVLRLTGADRFQFLNSLSSQQFPFPQGNSCEALFMDGQGHIKWSVGVICGISEGETGRGSAAGLSAGLGAATDTTVATAANTATNTATRGSVSSGGLGISRGAKSSADTVASTGTFVGEDTDALWLLCEPEVTQDLREYLLSMRFMLRVEIQDASDTYLAFACTNSRVQVSNYGAGSVDSESSVDSVGSTDSADSSSGQDAPECQCPQGHRVLVWTDPWPGPIAGSATYFQGSHPGRFLPTTYYLVPVSQAADFVEFWLQTANELLESGQFETLEALLVGTQAVEACRVAAWRPRLSAEVDAKAIPNELDWLRTAASTEKGCYPGQETVARIINLGKPPRRLTFLQVDGLTGELPNPGDPIVLVEGGRPIGKVTSVANHFEMGPIALALVRTSTDPDAVLLVEVGSPEDDSKDETGDDSRKLVAVSQEIIVPVNGKADISPAERPGANLSRGQGAKRSGLMGKGF